MLFFFRRKNGPFIRGNTAGEQFMRVMLLIAIFAVCGWAFWVNTDRSLTALEARSTVWDEADLLSREQKQAWQKYASLLREEFGLRLRIHVRNATVDLPELDSKTIFIGLNPETGQVLVEMPPLVRKALGDDYLYAIQNDQLPHYIKTGEWQQGMETTLAKLWRDLSKG